MKKNHAVKSFVQKNRFISGLVIMLTGAVVLLIVLSLFIKKDKKDQDYLVDEKTVLISHEAEGFVIRSEVVLNVSGIGTVLPETNDGRRVCKGEAVASSYNGSGAGAIRETIEDLDRQIAELKDTYSLLLSKNSLTLEEHTKNSIAQVSRRSALGDFSGSLAAKRMLNTIADTRSGSANAQADYESLLHSLQGQKAQNIEKLGDRVQTVNAPCAGVYMHTLDGFEQMLPLEKADTITPADFAQLEAATPAVNSNSPGKIIDNFGWYFAVRLPAPQAANLMGNGQSGSSSATLLFDSGEKITAPIYRAEADDDNAVLVFALRQTVTGMFDTRKMHVTVIEKEYKGLAIPVAYTHIYSEGMELECDAKVVNNEAEADQDNMAIVHHDFEGENQFVYVKKPGLTTLRWFREIYRNDEFVLAEENSGIPYSVERYDVLLP